MLKKIIFLSLFFIMQCMIPQEIVSQQEEPYNSMFYTPTVIFSTLSDTFNTFIDEYDFYTFGYKLYDIKNPALSNDTLLKKELITAFFQPRNVTLPLADKELNDLILFANNLDQSYNGDLINHYGRIIEYKDWKGNIVAYLNSYFAMRTIIAVKKNSPLFMQAILLKEAERVLAEDRRSEYQAMMSFSEDIRNGKFGEPVEFPREQAS